MSRRTWTAGHERLAARAVRGGHVTLEHEAMDDVVAALWTRRVIPDFRPPRGLRAGLSPLSTSFTELAVALAHVHRELSRA